ncbi:hypothetical protein PFICI_06774 [Pestalotiopsis fici W106-1]|uniref:Uncharacterized protein n=1 Tax=Pestalotiopsis fici (strain W106-1 / CGMCC3.15140) TaxID=1229662 RepID=W3X8Q7_PESFW|nr:uncharacterized protein PFICI_06774 [Pestalotiopsis fici W106-1]ETS81772.1 hypothetical protein PFICI_06774 [Pestalotiopsis fici W106-1]
MLPHSKESGHSAKVIYKHTQDAYADKWPAEKSWRVDDNEGKYKYLRHIKKLSRAWPHLRYLAQWMEVTTSPVKWEQMLQLGDDRDNYRAERAARTNVAVVDFAKDSVEVVERIDQGDNLLKTLKTPQPEGVNRLYIVEDLSRDMIEYFGRELDIDPLFFREHINDYLWYNTRDPWVELPDLDIVARERNFFRLSYVQPRYFSDIRSFQDAREEAGRFNVLRRLDDDGDHKALFDSEDAIVALLRSKASLWIKPQAEGNDKGSTGVLLIDPSITRGHALWGGYRPFWNSPTYSQGQEEYEWQPKSSVLKDLLFWITQMTKEDIESISTNPKAMMFRMAQIICSDWNILVRYITARLGQIEWELERPDFRLNSKGKNQYDGSLAASLHKLHTWRRRLPLYKAMVKETEEKLFGELLAPRDTNPNDCLLKMKKDFEIVTAGLVELWDRTERIATVATAVTSIEESRRAMDQNRALGRLTYLAVIFAPLSFISSFFSMAPELGELTRTIWIYFVVAIPVSLIAFLLVEPSVLKFLKSFLPKHSEKKKN